MSFKAHEVTAALATVIDPNTNTDFFSSRRLKNFEISGNDVSFDIELGYAANSQTTALREMLIAAAKRVPGVGEVSVNLIAKVEAHNARRGVDLMKGVKNVIAVASGKGGVGKSTTAVNLALSLAHEGARVGLLDADIYGPSQPMMTGTKGRPESLDGVLMEPKQAYGLQVNSVGFLSKEDDAMVWRGPMASNALEQLLLQTRWHDLDYLIIDMPPGTGDIAITLTQKVPLTGAVIVTTPQDIALIDAKKGLKMFERVKVPILGVIENMAIHRCTNCGHTEHIFGEGGGKQLCESYGVEYLGALPLDIRIRLQADSGKPTVAADPNSDVALLYRSIATRIAAKVAASKKMVAHKFPPIKIVSA